MGFLSALTPLLLPPDCIYLGTQTTEILFFLKHLQYSVGGKIF